MMARLLNRVEQIARANQQRKVRETAARLRELLRGASIEVDEARILVSGRGIVKRWLIDPSLRFLGGGFK